MTETENKMNNPAYELSMVLPGSWTMDGRQPRRTEAVQYWLLELIVSGSMQVRIPSVPWMSVGIGEGILYAPGTVHDERVPDGACKSIGVYFDVHSEALAGRLARDRGVWRIADNESFAMRQLERLLEIQNSSDVDGPGRLGRLGGHGCLCLLVWMLLAAARKDGWFLLEKRQSMMPEAVFRAHRFMRQHLHERIRIADIAVHACLSPSGLQHAFRRATGRPPMVVLREMRVEAAKVLLLRTGMTVEEISANTGFADAFHLSRVFKQLTGERPQAYRRLRGGTGSTTTPKNQPD
jgi:AraC-like DNA-binding protein